MEPIFRDDPYARACEARIVAADAGGIRLDRTVFYPTGGGQPGDTGRLVLPDGGTIAVAGAVKAEGEDVLHLVPEGTPLPQPGTPVSVELDWTRRYRHMRMHTALHLLCVAVPGGVTGGQIGADRSRLDFDLQDTTLDRDEIAAAINGFVAADRPVEPRWITEAELDANPGLVRTMSVKPPTGAGRIRMIAIEGVDLQPCGGTHVRRTGEIGRIAVTKIESKGKRNRRVNIAFAEET